MFVFKCTYCNGRAGMARFQVVLLKVKHRLELEDHIKIRGAEYKSAGTSACADVLMRQ
jgi:hypothetical protein